MNSNNAITEEQFAMIDKTRRDISITLYKTELPDTIHGFCRQRKDGKYIIFLNSAEEPAQQTATFLHECLHIYHDDHNSELDATEIEAIRHSELLEMLELMKTL